MPNTAMLSVVVVYEDLETREAAVTFCDRLVEKYWAQFGFNVGWWSFELLSQETSAREASVRAAAADLVVFATRADPEFPLHIEDWVNAWLARRENREGALVGLVAPGEDPGRAGKECRLRQLALRAELDYFTQVPQNLRCPVPDECEGYTDRARQMTDLLEEILRPPPPRSLL